MELTQDRVRELFDYREDGALIWRVYRSSNARPGDVAGYMKSHGYLYVSINEKRFIVHRVVFLWHHGYLPPDVDHINGVRSDNRIENLREASRSQNLHNSKKSSRNTSGYKGVSWCDRRQKWRANICTNYKQRSLGYFDTAELAAAAYAEAAAKDHGSFARIA